MHQTVIVLARIHSAPLYIWHTSSTSLHVFDINQYLPNMFFLLSSSSSSSMLRRRKKKSRILYVWKNGICIITYHLPHTNTIYQLQLTTSTYHLPLNTYYLEKDGWLWYPSRDAGNGTNIYTNRHRQADRHTLQLIGSTSQDADWVKTLKLFYFRLILKRNHELEVYSAIFHILAHNSNHKLIYYFDLEYLSPVCPLTVCLLSQLSS